MSLGSVEYALVTFGGDRFTGAIVPALADLTTRGVVRIIDLVFIRKGSDGSVVTLELDDLAEDEAASFKALEHEVDDLLNTDDLLAEAAALPLGTAAAVVVWENLWSKQLETAVRAAGGQLVDQGRIPPELAELAMARHLADAE